MSKQSLPYEMKTVRIGWRVMGHADRLVLPDKIVDFCGSFPIYNVEPIPLDLMNTTMVRVSSKSDLSSIWNIATGYLNLSNKLLDFTIGKKNISRPLRNGITLPLLLTKLKQLVTTSNGIILIFWRKQKLTTIVKSIRPCLYWQELQSALNVNVSGEKQSFSIVVIWQTVSVWNV